MIYIVLGANNDGGTLRIVYVTSDEQDASKKAEIWAKAVNPLAEEVNPNAWGLPLSTDLIASVDSMELMSTQRFDAWIAANQNYQQTMNELGDAKE